MYHGKRQAMLKITVGLLLAVVAMVTIPAAHAQDQAEGKRLYLTHCATCHGDKGRGDGPVAGVLPVKPANHADGTVMNQLSDKILVEIIAKGGASVGRSPVMPAWGAQFKEKQLQDIIAYIRSLADPPYRPGK